MSVPDIRQLVELARERIEGGQMASAGTIYQAILDDTTEIETGVQRIARGEACVFYARQAVANLRYGEACDWYHAALTADPLAVEYRLEYINRALLQIDMLSVARLEAKRACVIEPENAYCWRTAAAVEREANDSEAAQGFMDRAFECDPEDGATKMFQAAMWADLGKFKEALALFTEVEREHPKERAEILHNRGIIYDRLGDHDRAIQCMDEAIATPGLREPVLARWNRAGMLLAVGRYEEGWPQHGIMRADVEKLLPKMTPRQAAGLGRSGWRFRAPWFTLDMSPCRVHVHPEQGWGDVVCMSRYLPAIRDLGHDVRFEVDEKMVDLFRESPAMAGITILPKAIDFPGGLGIPEFDVHAMTMEMPGLFGTTLDNIPLAEGWLGVTDERYESQFIDGNGRPRVGICWSSGIREGFWLTEYGRRKSVGRENAYRLMDMVPDVGWYIFDFDERPMSFADAAAILLNLDLLITVDSAITHLAGALGVPTWVMMHEPGATWHFMERDQFPTTSPWYDSVRLYRQDRPHEWGGVVERIATDLNAQRSTGS